MRGRHFKKEIKVVAKWRTSGVLKLQSPEQSTFKQNLKEVKPENVFPLILNLVSCFLVSRHTRPLAESFFAQSYTDLPCSSL